jgi:hypothetical protein
MGVSPLGSRSASTYVRSIIALFSLAVLMLFQERAAGAQPQQGSSSTAGSPTPVAVVATVQRTVKGKILVLPAAFVPMLRDGDIVSVAFPAFDERTMASGKWQLHEDAFFQPVGQQTRFFFQDGSGHSDASADALYLGAAPKTIRFTYTAAGFGTQPLFFLIPDYHPGGDDGGAHTYVSQFAATFFSGQSAQSNIAVNSTSFAASLINGLSASAVDLTPTGKSNVLTLIGAATGNSSSANTAAAACYGTTAAQKAAEPACIEAALLSSMASATPQPGVAQPNNIANNGNAPAVLGAAVGELFPSYAAVGMAIGLLGTIFAHPRPAGSGYQFINGSLIYTSQPNTSAIAGGAESVLVPTTFDFGVDTHGQDKPKVGAVYFSIGGLTSDAPPTVTLDTSGTAATGVCGTNPVVSVPLKLTPPGALTSTPPTYYHDVEITDTSAQGYQPIQISNTALGADVLANRSDIDQSGKRAYSMRLTGAWGFSDLTNNVVAVVAIPGHALWSIDPNKSTPAVVGANVVYALKSDAAPCFANAQLTQSGTTTTTATSITRLSATEIQMTFNLSGFVAGIPAKLQIMQQPDSARANQVFEDDADVAIGPAVPTVTGNPAIHFGDHAIALAGTNLWNYDIIKVGNVSFARDLTANSGSPASACFVSSSNFKSGTVNHIVPASFYQSAGSAPISSFSAAVTNTRPTIGKISVKSAGGDFVLPSGPYYNASYPINLVTESSPITASALFVREGQPPDACEAVQGVTTAGGAAVSPVTVQAHGLFANFTPTTTVSGAGYGSLQIAVVDSAHSSMSDWQAVPGTFVREPTIDQIDCSKSSQDCEMTGTNLVWIEQISDKTLGTQTAAYSPITPCRGTAPAAPKTCLIVPRYAQYRFQLVDIPGYWLVDSTLNVILPKNTQ